MNATATLDVLQLESAIIGSSKLTWQIRPALPLQPGQEDPTENIVVILPTYGEWGMAAGAPESLAVEVALERMERGEQESTAVSIVPEQLGRPRLRPTYLSSGRPLLTDRVEATLERLFPIIERLVRREKVPVRKLEVFGFRDSEEGWQELVVSLSVKLPEQHALLLWDKLGHMIEGQMEFLPRYMVAILYDRICIEVLGQLGEAV